MQLRKRPGQKDMLLIGIEVIVPGQNKDTTSGFANLGFQPMRKVSVYNGDVPFQTDSNGIVIT